MQPWTVLHAAKAPDGTVLELRRRGHEYLIRAGGYDLMSTEDERSASALADLGCAELRADAPLHVLIGGLGMGFTLRAALDRCGPRTICEVAELVPEVADWNRGPLGEKSGYPLNDSRTRLYVGDVAERIATARGEFDAILLDVDNGPDALAHAHNESLYRGRGLAAARLALKPGGVLGTWSFSDDRGYTERLKRAGFDPRVHRVPASRKGRGLRHVIWIARRMGP